jgi:hypothetical protein
MKKILVTLFLVSSLVFALAAGAMANSVYVDNMVGGTSKFEGTEEGESYSFKPDLNDLTLGTNINCGKLLFNLEYSKDTIKASGEGEDTEDTDFNIINFKLGYALIGDEQSYLALTAGYHQMKYDDDSSEKIYGVIIGLSAASDLSEKSMLAGSVGYSVSGTAKSKDEDTLATVKDDIDILLLQVKYSYYFTANFGLGIGYKLTQYKGDDDSKLTQSGPTAGLTYKF